MGRPGPRWRLALATAAIAIAAGAIVVSVGSSPAGDARTGSASAPSTSATGQTGTVAGSAPSTGGSGPGGTGAPASGGSGVGSGPGAGGSATSGEPSTAGAQTGGANPSTTVPTVVPTPPPLGWSTCGTDRQCSTLVVPLDYANPTGAHIGIALERRPASDSERRIGSLVINPGGPGESGIGNFEKDLSILPGGVLDRFDIVTFDPRGVGASEGIHCTGDNYTGPEPDPVPETSAAQQLLVASDRAYADACARSAGALLAHVGTLDVARDLEELRMALGDAGLSYLGMSYGTLIGATYASLFPTHVRAMVLDGPLDPSLSTADLADNQAEGFEQALDSFFAWCVATPAQCSWHPGSDPRAAFEALAESVRAHPLSVGTTTVGPAEFYTGTFGTLYATSFWPGLGRALAGIAAGDGSEMVGLFNGYERVGDPSFDGDANNAVTCLDHPVPTDLALYPAQAAAAAAVAPDFGPLFAWGAVSCAVWPVPASDRRQPGSILAAGSPPILVVGTTGDPATPYSWAKSLASQLQHGVLLTRDGLDHVALFYSSCVRTWDQSYLETVQPPPAGTVCPS